MRHKRLPLTDVPFYPGLTYRPPPKLIRLSMPGSHESTQVQIVQKAQMLVQRSMWISRKILHFRKELFQKLTKDQISHSSRTLRIARSNEYQHFSANIFTHKANMDKILKVTQRKVLRGMHFAC